MTGLKAKSVRFRVPHNMYYQTRQVPATQGLRSGVRCASPCLAGSVPELEFRALGARVLVRPRSTVRLRTLVRRWQWDRRGSVQLAMWCRVILELHRLGA